MRYHLQMVKAKTVESQCVPAGSTTKGIVLPGNAFLLENVVSFSFYNLLTHGQVPKLLKSFCLCTYLFEIILNIWEPSSLSFRKIYDVIDAGLSVFRTLWSCHSRLIIFSAPFDCSCRSHEEYVACPPACPTDSCSQATPSGRCPIIGRIGIVVACKPACRCVKGYWRDNGICVPYLECRK